MKLAINEGEKAMSGAVFAFGRAASKGKMGSSPDVIRIIDSSGAAESGVAPEGYIRGYFRDVEKKVEDARSGDLLIYLAKNLMGTKLVVSQYLRDRFEKEKLELLEMIFYRRGVLK